jgi:lauroyl/myristoyl acyltransferase
MRTMLERTVAALRRAVPAPLLPLLVAVRTRLAWSRAAVRADARAQMGFLLEHTRPEADLETVARAYVRYQARRGELRWHPRLVTRMRVKGIEHLAGARDRGHGVLLNFMHHGYYDGAFPSFARLGVRCNMVVYPYMLEPDAPLWLQQHVALACIGGGRPVSAAVGTEGMLDLLGSGEVLAIASDVPGRTPLRFAGRDVLGSFGAARLATDAAAPVVVMTSEEDARGPYIRLHAPLEPAAFASPQELLEAMLAIHESAQTRWPEATDLPLSRWGRVEAADGAREVAP